MLIGGLAFLFMTSRQEKKIAAETAAGGDRRQARPKELPHRRPKRCSGRWKRAWRNSSASAAKQEAEALMTLKLPAVATKKTEVLTQAHRGRGEEGPDGDGAGGPELAQW